MESRNAKQEWVHLVLKKTMEEVSAGFGVTFHGKYESGDFEEDYEEMEDDPFNLFFSSFSPIRHSTIWQRHRVFK